MADKTKFIQLTITPRGCRRYLNVDHIISFVSEEKPGNAVVTTDEHRGTHFVEETPEQIMELIEGA